MSRNQRAINVLTTLREHERLESWMVTRLAIKHGVSLRTIYRDIESLKRGGFTGVPPFAYRESDNAV